MDALTINDLPHYTYEDYISWEGRWEIIRGIPYAMSPAPDLKHQLISNNIASELKQRLAQCPQCHALLPVDWKISEDTIVQPDNLVICYEPEGKYITRAPSIIFEVLSPSTFLKDVNLKFKLYEHEGVKYYILVNPEDKIAKIFQLKDGKYIKVLDATNEKILFDIDICKIEFDFAKIW
jgi:Uma2 family endonuclease